MTKSLYLPLTEKIDKLRLDQRYLDKTIPQIISPLFWNLLERYGEDLQPEMKEKFFTYLELVKKFPKDEIYNFIDLKTPNFIFTKMTSPYSTNLGLEYFCHEIVEDKLGIKNQYPSLASPIELQFYSKGLSNPRFLALFAENWALTKDQFILHEKMPVYYFIDRFIQRFLVFTKPIILAKCESEAFPHLHDISQEEIKIAATSWVLLHEHFHSHSFLPLPQSLPYKNTRNAGSFEELRVDLKALTTLHQNLYLPSSTLTPKIKEYILAERLLHYASNYLPSKDYDAVSSQIFFNLLSRENIIKFRKGRIYFSERLWPVIYSLSQELDFLEKEASQQNSFKGKEIFEKFTKSWGNFNSSLSLFERLPFFEESNLFLENLNSQRVSGIKKVA